MENNDLTPEQREKVLACQTPEELLELAKSEGYELSEDETSTISGGASWTAAKQDVMCPRCGSHDVYVFSKVQPNGRRDCRCHDCGKSFTIGKYHGI